MDAPIKAEWYGSWTCSHRGSPECKEFNEKHGAPICPLCEYWMRDNEE